MSWKEGDLVFFFHPKHSWVAGNVVGSGKGIFSCKANDVLRKVIGETVDKLKEEQITQCREDLLEENVNDLLSLTILHDATLLRCLFLRYMKDIIYTNIGAIVVALNPFNFKIPKYMDSMMPEYLNEGDRIEKNVPHSWAQAHNTYYEMVLDKGDQCILISGESGAGKTEAAKIVMKYLAQISAKRGTAEEKAAGLAVGTKLTMCSPVLEAFGNAKTVRNDNSSRFGKFMKVKFTPDGKLVGAFTIKYLLEKSRIITASEKERVYHSFYVVVRGKSHGLRLAADKDYKSLNSGKCLNNKEFDTEEAYEEVVDSMKNIKMNDQEIKSAWSLTAGILWFLNVAFQDDGEGSKIDPNTAPALQQAVTLWKVNASNLLTELVTTTFEIKGALTTKKLTPVQAVDGRDATCKALYDSVFSWIVTKCNDTCDVPDTGGNWIGLLDIFGFEDFEKNSFEQICINLANETLQNHYNTYIFTKDMEECKAEGVDVQDIKCPDNKPCLMLITGKMGIMDLLDEECSLGQGTDEAFLTKCDQQHNKNAFFAKSKLIKSTFVINHYAGNVKYNVEGWLEKNRDTLKDALKLLLRASEDPVIAELLPVPLTADQKKGKALTVGGFFKSQVGSLMDVINSTNPHWIRCIKPHPAKKPLMFDGISTMEQLESSGVLGTVKIRKAGYPIRPDFERFAKRYLIMANASGGAQPATTASPASPKPGGKGAAAAPPPAADTGGSTDWKKLCEKIIAYAGITGKDMSQVGKTKVFLKSEAYPVLERKRGELLLKYILRIQAWGQGTLCRKSLCKPYWDMKWGNAAMVVQKEYRDYVSRSQEIRRERARLRKEMEDRIAAATSNLIKEEQDAREALWEECGPHDYEIMRNQLAGLIEKEKEKLELTKGERVDLENKEYAARVALYNEFAQQGSELAQLRLTEVMVWAEIELYSLGSTEFSGRDRVWVEEEANARELRRQVTLINTGLMLQQSQLREERARYVWKAMEVLQREEMKKRFRGLRREQEERGEVKALAAHHFETVSAAQRRKHKLIRRRERQLSQLHGMWSREADRVGGAAGSYYEQDEGADNIEW
eukprot:PhF_6_TR26182/c0_g1_i3/m.37218